MDDQNNRRRRINTSKLNYLILQGTAYLLLAYAALIWAKYSKGFWWYMNAFFGLAFLFWGVTDFLYLIFLIYNEPIEIFDYEII